MTIIPTHYERLTAENDALRAMVERLKEREGRYVRCIATMLDTPAQSVASAQYKDGQWEVIMTTGAVWRRVEKMIDTPTECRYFESWVPRPAVPGSRAALAEALEDAEAIPPLHLLPGRVA